MLVSACVTYEQVRLQLCCVRCITARIVACISACVQVCMCRVWPCTVMDPHGQHPEAYPLNKLHICFLRPIFTHLRARSNSLTHPPTHALTHSHARIPRTAGTHAGTHAHTHTCAHTLTHSLRALTRECHLICTHTHIRVRILFMSMGWCSYVFSWSSNKANQWAPSTSLGT